MASVVPIPPALLLEPNANSNSSDEAATTTAMLVQYLRTEADAAEQRAAQLRNQAAQIAALHNISPEIQQRYELDATELPPVDEHGVPKYAGRKRGRKPKPRKRKSNPARRKRQHTAYTLFVQENYPLVRSQHPAWPSKDVISVVAKQWAAVPAAEKKLWKERAVATHTADAGDADNSSAAAAAAASAASTQATAAAAAAATGVAGSGDDQAVAAAVAAAAAASLATYDDEAEEEQDDEEQEEEEEDEEEEEEEEAAPPARRRTRKS